MDISKNIENCIFLMAAIFNFSIARMLSWSESQNQQTIFWHFEALNMITVSVWCILRIVVAAILDFAL